MKNYLNLEVLEKRLSGFEKMIVEKCNELGIKVQLGENIIYLFTGLAHWRLYLNSDNSLDCAMHENYRFKKHSGLNSHKTYNGFHRQKLRSNNIESVLEYIYDHDRKFFRGPGLA